MLLELQPTIDEIVKIEISDSDPSFKVGGQFKDLLKAGFEEVENIERTRRFDFIARYQDGRRILKFLKKLKNFIELHGPPSLILTKKLEADWRARDADLKGCFEHLVEIVNAGMTNNSVSNITMLQRFDTVDGTLEATASQQSISYTYQVPDIPNFVVDLYNRIDNVKQLLLQNDVNIVGVTGMGGSGKTTLASALCDDTQVKEFFRNKIIFITVSQSPNVKGLLDTMWLKIIDLPKPDFQSTEDAHNQLQKALTLKNLSSETYRPILVVLDNVWSRADLEHFLFEAKGYKTIYTTRENFAIPITDGRRQYEMPMLNNEDSLKLFCFWAFDQHSIPTNEYEDLVQQVAAGCNGLPLALTVIGSCLRDQPWPVWKSAKEKLSRAESISSYHREKVLERLETSIDVLRDDSRQCFLDLGAFPKGRKFSVDALLDIWVYVRGMEWNDAFAVFLELAKGNLLNLTSDRGSQAISGYSCASHISFFQHDVMRDLAFNLAIQDSTNYCSRLFMSRKEDNIPTEWISLKEQTSKAQFVSIHTGQMEQEWGQIHFPEVETLALFFEASQYRLPTFLRTMPKLKVVIIYNYSSKRAKLHGLPSFSLFTQIKSVVLERLDVSALYGYCRSSESLEKFSLCLCEGFGNTPLPSLEKFSVIQFPKFIEINFDHCSDLEQLPEKICNLTSLQRLSVTNCHLIQKLPDDLGKLRSLRMLRLSACLNLSMLPASICELHQLECLDISLCGSLKNFPNEFHRLSKLKMLDMRECSGLKKLPEALTKLRSLTRVTCDEHTERQWLSIKASAMPNLIIVVVKECFNLDWLEN
uniref:Uncharacterized protein n=1 Tax=Picea sitchensis TaxID=3332 RepID=B8LKQ3_PICSI|nr:unknown [Picea sitchensis]